MKSLGKSGHWKGTVKVGKNGVTLKLYGHELQYTTAELWREYFGQDVYVRYDPDNLNSVRIYSTDKRLICEAPLKTMLGYDATKEELQEAQRENHSAIKAVKNYKKAKNVAAQTELEAVLNKAAENISVPEDFDPKTLRLIQTDEDYLPMAVGAENDFNQPIDWTEALNWLNTRRFKNVSK